MGIGGIYSADAQPDMQLSSAFTQLGTTARDCLTDGRRGKVLAVFSKAIYLLADDEELFWITTEDAPMHRRSAATSPPLPGPSVGSPFHIAEHHLRMDPGFIFEIEDIPPWNEPRLDPKDVPDLTKLPAHIHSCFANLDDPQAKGFGIFIPHILSLSQTEIINPSSEALDPILRVAEPLVLDMARACLEQRPSRIPQITDKLIGLGTGLTPSGDDFIGAYLFAINHLQAAYPDFDFTNYAVPIELYRPRTHLISFALLKDHASGHAIELLHSIINGLLSGETFESIYPFISQLTQMGHSTGWDLLTGLLVGLLLTNSSLR